MRVLIILLLIAAPVFAESPAQTRIRIAMAMERARHASIKTESPTDLASIPTIDFDLSALDAAPAVQPVPFGQATMPAIPARDAAPATAKSPYSTTTNGTAATSIAAPSVARSGGTMTAPIPTWADNCPPGQP